MLVKGRFRHRFQRTGGVYRYKYRNRLPTHESKFDIPIRPRCGGEPICRGRAVSALRVHVVVLKLVSTSLLNFLCRVEVPELGGADISLNILVKVSVFRIDS